ncbi:hypothetical protein BV20DRAFT_1056785 [Pilatotrama ljubarskyi]|nr:hypothetical protein BV20DRAFT_1056785 [Pilatotrama ljubarskyi]
MTFSDTRSSTESRRAADPFKSKDANVILQTSDHVEFRVHKNVTALASPATSASSTASSRSHHKRRLVDLPQTSAVLDLFLRFTYPTPEPTLALDDIATLLELARKYDTRCVTTRMRAHLLRPNHLEDDPTTVYALASFAGMIDVARIAARYTLSRALPARLAEVRLLDGTALVRLLQYRKNSIKAATDVVRREGVVPCAECASALPRCKLAWRRKTLHEAVVAPQYWVDYVHGVKAALQLKLDPSVVRDPALMRPAVESGTGCTRCASKAHWDLDEFADILEEVIEEAISGVKLHLDSDDLDDYDTRDTALCTKER